MELIGHGYTMLYAKCRDICSLFAISTLLFAVCTVSAHQVAPSTDELPQSSNGRVLAVIKQKLDYYNQTYPDIRFVHADGGSDWHGDLVAILMMLGVNADTLDYQHPPEVRETLLNVTLERLKRFLEADVVSATLFRVGKNSVINRPNLCVITLNPDVFIANDYQATRYMLDLSDAEMEKVHPARYLNHIHHLEFTLDHEALHCLDSYFNGGSPQTTAEFGGEYNLFLRESIADAYALMMHIRIHGDSTRYAKNIVHARALLIFSDSSNRCTFETIREVLDYDHEVIKKMPVRDIIGLATHIRNKTVGDYEAYLVQHAAAISAAAAMGKNVAHYGQQWQELAGLPGNKALIAHLINRYEFYYQMLFTDDVIPLEAPHGHDWKQPSD